LGARGPVSVNGEVTVPSGVEPRMSVYVMAPCGGASVPVHDKVIVVEEAGIAVKFAMEGKGKLFTVALALAVSPCPSLAVSVYV
jgi:hypothetical protein